MEPNEEFRAIFDQGASSDRSNVLAKWFAQLAVDQLTSNAALQVFDVHGSLFSESLWNEMLAAVRDALESGEPGADRARVWIPLLVQAAPRYSAPDLGGLLEVFDLDARRLEALLVFDRLVAPDAELQPDLDGFNDGSAEARKLGFGKPGQAAAGYWEEELRPRLADDWSLAAEVVAMADRHLRSAHHGRRFQRRPGKRMGIAQFPQRRGRPAST